MLSALPPEIAGLLALLALALFPGVLIVRAPWTVVPALSVAFWTLSWWWIPVASRTRALEFVLVAGAVLGVLRLLPKHVVPPPPGHPGPPPPPPVTGPQTGKTPRLRSGPALLVLAVAVALLAPLVLMQHAPGREMAFHTSAARAAVWRDALPTTYEPLLPLAPFGAHAPALGTLAADVSLLSGLPPGRAVALAALAAAALLLLGVFALLAVWLPARSAALAALLGLAAVRWPGFFAMWGEGAPLLGLALGIGAAVLLMGHRSWPSSVGAGMLLGAALLAHPVLAVVTALVVAAAGVSGSRRAGLAFAVAAVVATPGLWRLGQALSFREAWAVVVSVDGAEVMDALMGLVLLALVAFLASRLAGTAPERPAGARALVLTAGGAVLLLVRVAVGLGAGQLPSATLEDLATLEGAGRPLEAVCAPEPLIDWVPALAGRAPGRSAAQGAEPWVPPALQEERLRRAPRPCSKILDGPPRGRHKL